MSPLKSFIPPPCDVLTQIELKQSEINLTQTVQGKIISPEELTLSLDKTHNHREVTTE